MGDILAIISKAQFEAAHRAAKPGDVLNITQYVSTHAALEPVRDGGTIFLVTVRPPDEALWLIGALEDPKHDGKAWKVKSAGVAVKDITALIPKLKFNTGKGIQAKKGALGMSLQTPRLLTDEDVALLRGSKAAAPTKQKSEPASKAPPPAKKTAPVAAPEAPPVAAPAGADALARAEAALEAKNRPAALTALLDAWRACRAPELEDLIATVSKDAARAYPPLDPEADDYDAAWSAREKEGRVDELDHLLPGLWSDPKGSIPMRLRRLLDRGADPRLGAAMMTMVAEPPLTASSNFSMWTTLFKALPEYVDERAKKALQARAKRQGGDSQFWPKLTGWCEGVIEKLPATASLSDGDAKRVKSLQKLAGSLAKGAAPAPLVQAAAAKKAAPITGSPRELLEAGVKAMAAGELPSALEALRGAWEATRDASVAGAVEGLGLIVGATLEPLAGKPAEVHAAWMKRGKTFDAPQVTPLLDAIVAGKLSDAEERLEVMLSWRPDPRVAPAMLKLIDSYIGARPQLWKRVYDLLVLNADPRHVAFIEKNAQRLENAADFDRNRAERPHAVRTREPYVQACERARKPTKDEQALLDELLTRIDAMKKKGAAAASETMTQEEPLIRRIIENPDDVAARSVYADFLTERGDVRGEWLAMTVLQDTGQGKVKSKLDAYEKKHRKALLGVFSEASKWTLGWTHGFVTKVTVDEDPKGAGADAALADSRWAMVRELAFGEDAGTVIVERAPLWSLEVLHGRGRHVRAMALRELDWRLKTLDLDDFVVDGGWKSVPAKHLPRLERLEYDLWTEVPADFWASPIAQQLTSVQLGSEHSGGVAPVDVLLAGAAQLPRCERVELVHGYIKMTGTRSGDGFDLVLDIAKGWGRWDNDEPQFPVFSRIPKKAVTRLTLTTKNDDAKVEKRIREALGHLL